MKLLLDTHALIWWLVDAARLRDTVRAVIDDKANVVLVSAVSAIEVTTKYRSGKLPFVQKLAEDFSQVVAAERFIELPITCEHGQLAGLMQIPHKDPFDRLLIAQAQIEQARLVSNEALFDQFGVRRLW